ncbi:unnamed protein product [Adineta ricciae]|uniref:RING-type domain-containing protein n=2 Tax=Adineta ricciae TaxID=249248 RepID=A0A813P1Y8_ADIRI|nr:unnamed protein product [Adineta ricciae]
MATIELMPTNDLFKTSCTQHNCKSGCPNTIYKPILLSLESTSNKEQEYTPKTRPTFNEAESMKQSRLRSLSHWKYFKPSNKAMAAAGWFSCNVSDRVICIYCNTICQGWRTSDDPLEVHARLAPKCPFVLSQSALLTSPKIVNESVVERFEPHHPTMAGIVRREESFSKRAWPEDAPNVDILVRAGFFYSGTENIVTCFYCNGSLHKWGPHDKPIIEHARWFPKCTYAKHICGEKLYDQIQESKKRTSSTEQILSASELAQLVAARLDLPIVKHLQSQYTINIIKRCIEDQFKIKQDDFASDIDLSTACLILKKQIDHIKGCKDNILTPCDASKSEDSSQSSKQSLGECFICLTEEKQLACMPCGHLCACVVCGYALRTCPMCRQTIQGFDIAVIGDEMQMNTLSNSEDRHGLERTPLGLRKTMSRLPNLTLPENELIEVVHHNFKNKHIGIKLRRRFHQSGLLSYFGYFMFILFAIMASTVSIVLICLVSARKKDVPCTLKFKSMAIDFDKQHSRPQSIAIADFNNDTFLDVAVANSNTHNVGISLGTGTGILRRQKTYSTGSNSQPYSIAIGDFNNDNRLDIAAANFGTHQVGILIGDGSGNFHMESILSTGISQPLSISVGDLNNDNNLDLVVVNHATNCLDLFLGKGNGNFSFLTTYFTGYDSIPYSTILVDFNRDTYLDMIVLNNGANSIGVFLNQQNQSFTAQKMYSTGFQSSPCSFAVGDLDGDNALDIIVSNSGTGNLLLLFGNGQGTFEHRKNVSTNIYDQSQIIVADFNKDTKLDIAITDYSNSRIIILLGDQSFAYTNRLIYWNGFGTNPSSIATRDINNDNRLDILVTNYATNSIGVYLGYDPGVFKNTNSYFTGDFSNPKSIATGDLNNDNQTDIIVGNNQADNIGIFFGSGNGTFSNQTTYSTGSNSTPSCLQITDFNNDQRLDIIVTLSKSDTIGIFFGDGSGELSSLQTISVESGSTPTYVDIGDFNNDSCIDFVVGKYNLQNIGVFLGYCNGSFSNQTEYVTTSITNPDVIGIADMNNDRYVDIVVVDSFASNFSIFFNEGNGIFRNGTIYTSKYGLSATSIAIADIDRDQQLDLIIAYSLSNNIVIFYGKFSTNFDREVMYQNDLYSAPYSVSIGDLNNDDIVDIVVANGRNNNLGIFLGFPNGTFDDQINYSTGNNSGPSALTISNVNRDNRLDLLVTYSLSDYVAIFLGYDYGALQNPSVYTTGSASQPLSLAVGDFNHDNRYDLAIMDYGTEELEIRFGHDNGSFSTEMTYSTGSGSLPTDLALGDFNRDSYLDIVTTDFGANSISIFYGSENGTFTLKATYSTGTNSRPISVVTANINNDEWIDLVVSNSGANNISIFLGYQYTSLLAQVTYAIDLRSHPIYVIVGDFNNDNHLDVVSSTDGQATGSIFLGYGNGTFASPSTFSTISFRESQLIASGYFNHDQCLDLVTVNIYQSLFSIFLGSCNGSFENTAIYFNSNSSYPSAIVTGDFNHDNLSDIVLAISTSNSINIYFSKGNGTFTNATTYSTGIATSPSALAKFDFNNDTYLDIAVTNYNASSITIFFSSQNGSFLRQKIYSTGFNTTPSLITLGDFNSDRWIDILIINLMNNQVGVLLATQNGSFANQIKYSIQLIDKPSSIAVNDFNNDFFLDIVTTGSGDDTLRIYYGNNDGTFGLQTMYTTGAQSSPLSLAIGDFNGDDENDIVVANYATSNIGIFLAYCCEPFLIQTTVSTGNQSVPQSIAVGDLNHDDRMDLVVGNSNAENIGIFFGYGNGLFTNQMILATGNNSSPVSVALIDLNGDSWLDILVANYVNEAILIFLGENNGTFANPSTFHLDVGSRPSSITHVDLNENNQLSVVITDHGRNQVYLLQDYQNGVFTNVRSFATGYQSLPYAVAYADLNNDGMEDLMIALAGESNIGFISKMC